MPLERYRKKRSFTHTPEPRGKKDRAPSGPIFVVQKHKARRLHYDLRLEMDGVLKSWAIPRGPCLDPHQKRLAVNVEDHPLEYADFEGVIPKGEYGAGPMIVWDRGKWEPEEDALDAYAEGMIKFRLFGEKLRGRWMLVKLKPREGEPDRNWLLIKERDDEVRPLSEYDVLIESNSVRTGRTLDEVGRADSKAKSPNSRVHRSRREDRPELSTLVSGLAKAKTGPLPKSIKPQLAESASESPAGDRWLHEIKFDGYRLLVWIDDGRVTLRTRRGIDWTDRFPHLAAAARELPVNSAILDGEIVGLLPNGASSFAALINSFREGTVHRLVYFAFDLLYLNGFDLRKVPLEDRKAALANVLEGWRGNAIQYTDHIVGTGPDFFAECGKLGLEGVMSKRRDHPHRAGRSAEWLKAKYVLREEFVIGGFSEPEGARQGVGAILVGYYDGKKLRYAGRVGSGFTHRGLLELRRAVDELECQRNPFVDFPREKIERGTHWVAPKLVAQIEFANWTDDGLLWHPRFQELREDIRASDVVRAPLTVEERSGLRSEPQLVSRAKNRSPALPPAQAAETRFEELDGVRFTNPQRLLYDDPGLTKLDLVKYYAEIADWILPHIVDRPLNLVRCPDGQGHSQFYQKHPGVGLPDNIRRIEYERDGEPDTRLYVNDLGGLLSLVQFSVLEIHPWGARHDRPDRPDRLVFDLDPGEDVPWGQVVEAALQLRELLDDLGLRHFVKTTGGKGLHVLVPVQRRRNWDDGRAFARAVAKKLSAELPDRFTANMAKWAREGKVYVDCVANSRGSTVVAPYSTRARVGAPVSVPLEWDELPTTLGPDEFSVLNVRQRLAALERDPWAEIGCVRQSITAKIRKSLGVRSPK